MGASTSAPEPANVDLLPPRIDAKAQSISRLTASPFTYAFGRASRYALFGDFFADEGLRARLHLSPPTDSRARVALDVQGARGMVSAAAAGASLTDSLPTGQIVDGCVTVGTGQPLTLRGTVVDASAGVAAYARVPLSDSLARRAAGTGADFSPASYEDDAAGASASAVEASPTPLAGLGMGEGVLRVVGGVPIRADAPSTLVGRASNAFHVAGGDLSSITRRDDDSDLVGAAATRPARTASSSSASSAASSGAAAARGGVATAPPPAERALEWPEVGLAWASRSATAASAGLHLGLGPGMPAKAWAMGGAGDWMFGAQLSAFAEDAAAALRSSRGAFLATPFGPVPSRPSNEAVPLPVDLDLAISLRRLPVFRAALIFESARRDVVLGYQHHTTVRRKVYNPMEEKHVKGIYNYVDVGVEFRQPIDAGRQPGMAAAAAWQANRHLLLKLKAGTAGAAVSLASRAWTSPDLAVTLTAGVAPPGGQTLFQAPGEPYVGAFVSFGNAAAPPTYRKAVRGEQQQAQYRRFVARPDLSASRSEVVEEDALQAGLSTRSRVPVLSFDDETVIPRQD